MYRVAQKKWTAVQSVNIRLRKLLLYSDLILVECTLCSKKTCDHVFDDKLN